MLLKGAVKKTDRYPEPGKFHWNPVNPRRTETKMRFNRLFGTQGEDFNGLKGEGIQDEEPKFSLNTEPSISAR